MENQVNSSDKANQQSPESEGQSFGQHPLQASALASGPPAQSIPPPPFNPTGGEENGSGSSGQGADGSGEVPSFETIDPEVEYQRGFDSASNGLESPASYPKAKLASQGHAVIRGTPLENKESVSQGHAIIRGTPLENKESVSQGHAIIRGTPLENKEPVSQGHAVIRGTPLENKEPESQGHAVIRGTPIEKENPESPGSTVIPPLPSVEPDASNLSGLVQSLATMPFSNLVQEFTNLGAGFNALRDGDRTTIEQDFPSLLQPVGLLPGDAEASTESSADPLQIDPVLTFVDSEVDNYSPTSTAASANNVSIEDTEGSVDVSAGDREQMELSDTSPDDEISLGLGRLRTDIEDKRLDEVMPGYNAAQTETKADFGEGAVFPELEGEAEVLVGTAEFTVSEALSLEIPGIGVGSEEGKTLNGDHQGLIDTELAKEVSERMVLETALSTQDGSWVGLLDEQVAEAKVSQVGEKSAAVLAIGGHKQDWADANSDSLALFDSGALIEKGLVDADITAALDSGNTEISDAYGAAEASAVAEHTRIDEKRIEDKPKKPSGIWGAIAGWFKDAWNSFTGWLSGAWEGFKGFVTGLWDGLVSTIKGIVKTVRSTIKGLVDALSGALEDIVVLVLEAIVTNRLTFFELIEGVILALNTALTGIIETLATAVISILDIASAEIIAFLEAYEKGVIGILGGIWDVLLDILLTGRKIEFSGKAEYLDVISSRFNISLEIAELIFDHFLAQGLNPLENVDRIMSTGSGDFTGSSGVDVIIGGDGDNTINGGGGNDFIYGGDGHDTIYGDGGDDTIYAGAGNDDVHGGEGHDNIFGQEGFDEIYGGEGNDTLHNGTDTVHEADSTLDLGGFSGRIDLSGGFIEFSDPLDELVVIGVGEVGVAVPIFLGGFELKEITLYYSEEKGFYTAEGESTFFRLNGGLLGEVFQGSFDIGVNISINEGEVIGSPTFRFGALELSEENMLDPQSLSQLGAFLEIPGMDLGEEWENTSFRFEFTEGDLLLLIENIPVNMGDNFLGSIDLGFINGEFQIIGRVLIDIPDIGTGKLELSYSEGNLSGDAEMQFSYGPAFGDLQLSFDAGGFSAMGTGGLTTERLSGGVSFIFGRRSYVEQILSEQAGSLLNGEALTLPDEHHDHSLDTGEWVLAGSIDGLFHWNDKFTLSAAGVLDPNQDVTLKVKALQDGDIPLADSVEGEYGLEIPAFKAIYGIPHIADLEMQMGFDIGVRYNFPGPRLTGINASGTYTNSSYGWAQSEDEISLGGSLDMSGQEVDVYGGLFAEGSANALGNEASVKLNVDVDADLIAEESILTANMKLPPGADWKQPDFTLDGDFLAALTLSFRGNLEANITTWGHWWDKNYSVQLWDVSFLLGKLGAHVGYHPQEENPFQFGHRDGMDSYFEGPDWGAMFKALHEEHDENTGGVSEETRDPDWHYVTEPQWPEGIGTYYDDEDAAYVDGDAGFVNEDMEVSRRLANTPDGETEGPSSKNLATKQEALEDEGGEPRIPVELRPELTNLHVDYMNDEGEIHQVLIEPDENGVLRIFRRSTRTHLLPYANTVIKYYDDEIAKATIPAKVTALETKKGLAETFKTNIAQRKWVKAIKDFWKKDDKTDPHNHSTPNPNVVAARQKAWLVVKGILQELNKFDPGDATVIPTAPEKWEVTGSKGEKHPEKVTIKRLHTSQDRRWQGQESNVWNGLFQSDQKSNSNSLPDSGVKQGWSFIKENSLSGYWVAYHLVHFAVGGKSNGTNLICAEGDLNGDYEKKFEKTLQDWVDDGEVVDFEANIGYHSGAGIPDNVFPSSFDATVKKMKHDGSGWVVKDTPKTYNGPSNMLKLPVGKMGKFKVNDPTEYQDRARRRPYHLTSGTFDMMEKLLKAGNLSNDVHLYNLTATSTFSQIQKMGMSSGTSIDEDGLVTRVLKLISKNTKLKTASKRTNAARAFILTMSQTNVLNSFDFSDI